MKNKYALALAVAGCVVLLVAAAPAAPDSQREPNFEDDPRFVEEPDNLRYGHPVGVESNYNLYLEGLELPDPEHWGGAFVEGDRLVVTYVGLSAEDARWRLRSAGVRGAVDLRESGYSLATMRDAMDVVLGISGLDGMVSGLTPDAKNDRLIVEFADPGAVAAAIAIDVALPAAEIDEPTIEDIAAIDAAIDVPFVVTVSTSVAGATSRYYDNSPFRGGAAIKISASASQAGLCSSGFAWNPPTGTSGQLFVTAAHCRQGGDGVIRTIVSKYNSAGTTTKIGDIVWTSGDANGTRSGSLGDIAIVKLIAGAGTTTGWVYHGTYDAAAANSRKVVGPALALPAGWTATSSSKLYTSGAGPKNGNGDGQVMPDRVTATNHTQVYIDGLVTGRNQTFTGLTVAEHASDMVGSGDSGGAVYLIDSTGLRPLGIISGNNAVDIGPINARTYYTPLATVSSRYGGYVKSG